MSARLGRLRAVRPSTGARTAAGVLTGLAAVAAAGRFLAALAVNAPAGPGSAPVEALGVAAVVLAAGGLVGVGIDQPDPVAGVGLLFAGVFGLLSVAGTAAVPAAVAVPVGLGVFLATRRQSLSPPRFGLAAVLAGSLVLALASGVGDAAALRGVASTATLLGLGATPLLAADGRAFVAGCVALGLVVAAGLSLPFVTGAVTLVGVGAVGSPLPVVALGVGGGVTTASAALRRPDWPLLAGVVLLACAGVPATLGRAVPFALGVVALTGREGRR